MANAGWVVLESGLVVPMSSWEGPGSPTYEGTDQPGRRERAKRMGQRCAAPDCPFGRGHLGRHGRRRPTVPEVLPRVQKYMRQNPSGGPLHVSLSDGNLETQFIQGDFDDAIVHGDYEAAAIAYSLLRMTMTQRRKVYALSTGTT